jgi:MFS family permease
VRWAGWARCGRPGCCAPLGWAARGLRSPARDALLYDLVEPSAFGRASGAERAGDNAGALLGPLLASALLAWLGIRAALYLSAIPGVFAAAAITVAARQARHRLTAPEGLRTLSLNVRALRDAGLARALAPAAAFELGNVAATLLILRATQLLQDSGRGLTAAAALAVLLYAAHNGTAAVASLVGGHWADRAGPRRVFTVAALAYVAGYAVFAAGPHPWPVLLVGFVLAGVGIGFAETAQSTMVAQVAPAQLRGSAFGLLGLTQAFGDLGSTAVVGVLWAAVSPTLGFAYAVAWMLIAIVAATATAIAHRS